VMSASAPMMMTVSQSSMARGTLVGSSAASMSGGRGLAASSVGPDSGGVVIAGWSVRHARTPCHRADAGTRSVHLDREAVTDARGSMTIHVSGVSLAGWPWGWLLERLSGRVHRAPGTPLRECPPAFGLLLYFAAGSTRRPEHGECGCGVGGVGGVGGASAAADCRAMCGGEFLGFRERRAVVDG